MCFLYGKKVKEVMIWMVVVLGVGVLNEVALGAPVTKATTRGTRDLGHWDKVPAVSRPALVHDTPKTEEDNGTGQVAVESAKVINRAGSTVQKDSKSSGSIGSTNGTSISILRVQDTNEGSLKDAVGSSVESTIRVLNESLASSPADVHMSERGVRGMVKEVSSSLKEVGRNVKELIKLGREKGFKVLSRNESMIVVGVAGMSVGKSRSQSEKVVTDGKHVMVAVKGRDEDGRDETRDIRIKIGGKYNIESEKVYLVGDEGDTEWRTRIMIPLSVKKMKMKVVKECKEKDGGSGVKEDLCICEKMKDGKVKDDDVECVSGIVNKLTKMSKDNNMKVYKESGMCRNKKGMEKIYECMVRILEKVNEEDGYSSKSHGRSMLSWSGWMEDEALEEDDEEEGLEEEGGGRNKMMYIVFMVMFTLMMVCLNDLKSQCGRYRQERGKVYQIVRLPEYAQTIYSRMVCR